MNIVVPQLGESVIEARVAKWLKKAGDAVSQGDPLVELETDKIDLEVNADASGVLARIDQPEGADVKVGEVLGVIEESSVAAGLQPRESTPPPDSGAKAPPPQPSADVKATPTAKKVAADLGVDLSKVPATGEAGRVTKEDVQRAASTGAPSSTVSTGSTSAPPSTVGTNAPSSTASTGAPSHRSTGAPSSTASTSAPSSTVATGAPSHRSTGAAARPEERIRMSKRRATIAKRLVEAQHNAAMLTTFNEVDMTAVQALRARRKESFQKAHGVNLGLSSFFVKAAVGALKAFPRINAEIQGDEMVLKHYYDVGIAVGASSGLVVPVLRDADRMSFWDIEAGIKDFAKRAEDGTLGLEEIKGGTFTITNGGVFGSLLSTPILNPPQVGILGLHKIEERPIASGGQVVIRPMMYVALSYDHRIVDGLEAVQFLVRIKEFIEDPGHLLIEG
jgi:2-oxoglutarate dehydrogenase E2 component (dihydrolipoamide succinyltransferase)